MSRTFLESDQSRVVVVNGNAPSRVVVTVKTGPQGPAGAVIGTMGTGFLHYTAGILDGAIPVDPTTAGHMTVGAANTALTSDGTLGVWKILPGTPDRSVQRKNPDGTFGGASDVGITDDGAMFFGGDVSDVASSGDVRLPQGPIDTAEAFSIRQRNPANSGDITLFQTFRGSDGSLSLALGGDAFSVDGAGNAPDPATSIDAFYGWSRSFFQWTLTDDDTIVTGDYTGVLVRAHGTTGGTGIYAGKRMVDFNIRQHTNLSISGIRQYPDENDMGYGRDVFFFGEANQNPIPAGSGGHNPVNGIVLYVDTADNHLKWLKEDGTVVVPVNTLTNVGAGSQLVKTKSGINYDVRTITAGSGVSVTQNANDVQIGLSTTPAPVNASYLCVSNDATLTNERAVVAGTGISFSDGGPNSSFTINCTVGAAGSNTQVQYNNAGAFGADSGFTYGSGIATLSTALQVPKVRRDTTHTLIDSSATEVFLGTDNAYSNQVATVRIYSSAGGAMGISATNCITWDTGTTTVKARGATYGAEWTSSTVTIKDPGSGAVALQASTALAHGVPLYGYSNKAIRIGHRTVTCNGASSDISASSTAEAGMLTFQTGTTPSNPHDVTFPADDGSVWFLENSTSVTVRAKALGGSFNVSLAAGTRMIVAVSGSEIREWTAAH